MVSRNKSNSGWFYCGRSGLEFGVGRSDIEGADIIQGRRAIRFKTLVGQVAQDEWGDNVKRRLREEDPFPEGLLKKIAV